MYKGVAIELADGKRDKFLQEKTAGDVKHIKEDNLWRMLHSNCFIDAFQKNLNA